MLYYFKKWKAMGVFGMFFIFSFTLQAQWNLQGAEIDGEANDDFSGNSVSLSADGKTVAIGAYLNGTSRGHVRVYKFESGIWTQVGDDIDGEADNDESGWSVSLSADGNMVAIGATGNNGDGGISRGHVRVYKFIGGTWTQLGTDIDGEVDGDGSGHSVSLSADGSTVAIGTPSNDGGGSGIGRVQVYKFLNGNWQQLGADLNGEADNDHFGWSVSLSSDGNTVAIGAYGNDGGGAASGHVRVYMHKSGIWKQLGSDIDGEAADDESGTSVSLSADGSTVAIGAPHNDGAGPLSGHVRVYKFRSGDWKQLGDDIDGEMEVDLSGAFATVSLSADGSIVAIGGPRNDGAGEDAGHVRVYKFIDGIWTQLGTDIDGEADHDRSGNSVSLSADGSTVAIGAPRNDGGGFDEGHVRIYSFFCSPAEKLVNYILSLAKSSKKKLYVCHQGITTLEVTNPSLLFHLAHGDRLGKCQTFYCGLEIRENELDQFFVQEEPGREMLLYPNPAQDILRVKLPLEKDGTVRIRIHNTIGQSILDQHYFFNAKDQTGLALHIQNWPRGLYYLKATAEGFEKIKSFTRF